MKGLGFLVVLISLVIVAILVVKQNETKIIAPTGKEVKMNELPNEVKAQLDTMNQQAAKRMEDADKQD